MKKLLIQVFVISLVIWGCGKEDTPQQPGSGGWGQGGFGGFGARGATSVETQDVTLKPIAEQVRSYGTSQEAVFEGPPAHGITGKLIRPFSIRPGR